MFSRASTAAVSKKEGWGTQLDGDSCSGVCSSTDWLNQHSSDAPKRKSFCLFLTNKTRTQRKRRRDACPTITSIQLHASKQSPALISCRHTESYKPRFSTVMPEPVCTQHQFS